LLCSCAAACSSGGDDVDAVDVAAGGKRRVHARSPRAVAWPLVDGSSADRQRALFTQPSPERPGGFQ
jgi:hypothetical protein